MAFHSPFSGRELTRFGEELHFEEQKNVPVTVTGVGFFDFLHGQFGVAPNGVELHAVLDIQFATSGTPTPTATSTSTPIPTNTPIPTPAGT